MSPVEALAQERRARLAAERMLDLKQNELFAANAELSKHALTLTDQIIEKREEVEEVRDQNDRALQDLEQANEAVDIAERRLWDSVETVEDGFAVFDRHHHMIAANSAYLSVFDGLEGVAPGVAYKDILCFMAEEGIVDTGGLSRRDWCEKLSARWHGPNLPAETLKLWNGQFVKLVDRRSDNGDTVSLALDITDTIRREQQLNDARQKAEAANKAKSAFLAKMSHELRTPMNGVVGMADLLVETSLDGEQQLFVETIKNSGEALLGLINDVLDFSKMEAAKLVLHTDDFDLEQTLTEVLMLFQPAVLENDVELIIDYDMFLPTAFVGDAGRIRQVLTNLIGNAVKFTVSGHVMIRVVGVPEDGEKYRIHLTVEDTGPGIPADMLGHIFGEFNQVEDEKNRKYEGTGLGLAISKQLVELMGGEIWVDSTVDLGSNFGLTFSMPTQSGAVQNTTQLPDWVKRVIMQSSPSQSARILSKQLRILGLEVVDVTHKVPMPAEQLVPGDIWITDASQPDRDTEPVSQDQNVVPQIRMQKLGSDATPGNYEHDICLTKPVGLRSLVRAICDIQPPAPKVEILAPADAITAARKMRILAAEDNRTNRLVFGKLVGKLNVDLQFAENGVEALEKWQSFRPDMIFMDISMPIMDGKEATEEIRKAESKVGAGHVPIVALTAHAMDGDDTDILSAGLDHYLTKPLRKAAIFEQIRAAMPSNAEAVFDDESDKQADHPEPAT